MKRVMMISRLDDAHNGRPRAVGETEGPRQRDRAVRLEEVVGTREPGRLAQRDDGVLLRVISAPENLYSQRDDNGC